MGKGKENQSPDMNNLYSFLLKLSKRTHSMLLATATPIQLYPIELWDLLNVLSQKNDSVLGSQSSFWRKNSRIQDSLELISGKKSVFDELSENWDWMRNPFPPSEENPNFQVLRNMLHLQENIFVSQDLFSMMNSPVQHKVNVLLSNDFFQKYNPFIRHVVTGVFFNGDFKKKYKETIKAGVKSHKYKILLGTDSASEGINLQTLGTLINLDLPWNPTRLEQRKGRIQRIGQVNDTVHIYNMRYKDSVEDRVHDLLSERLKNITSIFGQLPDILEDVWIEVAQGEIEEAKKIIDNVPDKNPFEVRYNQNVSNIDWESCNKVLNNKEKRRYFKESW